MTKILWMMKRNPTTRTMTTIKSVFLVWTHAKHLWTSLKVKRCFSFIFAYLRHFAWEDIFLAAESLGRSAWHPCPLGVENMTSGNLMKQRCGFFSSAILVLTLILTMAVGLLMAPNLALARDKADGAQQSSGQVMEARSVDSVSESDAAESPSIFSRAFRAGPVVFLVLFILVSLSIVTWGALVSKWWHFKKVSKSSDAFVKSFWDSRSLNDLNSRLQEYPYSPAREIFRSGYAELVRGTQLREHSPSGDMAVGAAIENLSRALNKAKMFERRRMERFQSLLATSASASPFIGLFGTVWGIMGAFEGIAQTGSASLAAVAPGISEALIATAFGLAAAIPAVVGFNFFNSMIRSQLINLDGFCADFLNIVERYLVTDKKSGQVHHV